MLTKSPGAMVALALQALEHVVRKGVRLILVPIHAAFAVLMAAKPEAPAAAAPPDRTRSTGPAAPPPGGPSAAPAPGVPAEPRRAAAAGHVVLLARDPSSFFAHWHIHPTRRIEVLRSMGADAETTREVLRVHPTDGDSWHDVEVEPGASHAYVAVTRAGGTYRAELGLRSARGRFVPMLSSAPVTLPPPAPSPDLSVSWTVVPTAAASPRPARAQPAWNGVRVAVPAPATALAPVPVPEPDSEAPPVVLAGSSEAMPPGPRRKPVPPGPPGPRASDALPLR